MEFATRDQYRHAVERIAKYSASFETRSRQKVGCAGSGGPRPSGARTTAPRTWVSYLIGAGLEDLERAGRDVGCRFPEALGGSAAKSPVLLYIGGISLITLILAVFLVAKARSGARARPRARLFAQPWA